MKIKEGFVMREVAGRTVVIAVGQASEHFHGMINLNSTGKIIWEGVRDGLEEEAIAEKLTQQYDVSFEQASHDVHQMIQKMIAANIVSA